jgi:peptidoglycan/xylan/chitin deacetylase (PgdA/CDA1 family)
MVALKAWLDPARPWWRTPAGRLLRGALERVLLLAAAGLAAAQRLRGPGTGLALVYHRLAPSAGDPARELLPAIALDDFRAQLRVLRRHYRAVPASELPEAARTRRRGQRLPVAITFDDDDPGHLRHAAPALAAAGLPATFFLCGASLDAPRAFWWERLQALVDAGGTPPAGLPGDLHAAALAIEAMPAAERERVDGLLAAAVGDPPPDAGLRAPEVAALAATFEIGFHTLRHHSLDTLDDTELARAMREGRAPLEAAAGGALRCVAYPSGRTDVRTAGAAATAGFATGYTTTGRALLAGDDLRLIGRIEPRSPSLGVFALKLAGAPWRSAPQT